MWSYAKALINVFSKGPIFPPRSVNSLELVHRLTDGFNESGFHC